MAGVKGVAEFFASHGSAITAALGISSVIAVGSWSLSSMRKDIELNKKDIEMHAMRHQKDIEMHAKDIEANKKDIEMHAMRHQKDIEMHAKDIEANKKDIEMHAMRHQKDIEANQKDIEATALRLERDRARELLSLTYTEEMKSFRDALAAKSLMVLAIRAGAAVPATVLQQSLLCADSI